MFLTNRNKMKSKSNLCRVFWSKKMEIEIHQIKKKRTEKIEIQCPKLGHFLERTVGLVVFFASVFPCKYPNYFSLFPNCNNTFPFLFLLCVILLFFCILLTFFLRWFTSKKYKGKNQLGKMLQEKRLNWLVLPAISIPTANFGHCSKKIILFEA